MDYPQHLTKKTSIDQYSRFFEPRLPTNQTKYYENIIPLVSKIIYTANIERGDMNAYLAVENMILEALSEGQIGLARDWMTKWQTELGLTTSIGGLVIENIMSNKFEHIQRQDLYEHVDYPKRKGLLGRGNR